MSTTILIVDDSEIVLSVSRTILEQAGYRVLIQSRAARCMSQIICERPALVLMDVNMPDLEGGGLVDLCKRAHQVPGVSVVLYSGLDAKSLRRLVSMSGAHSFIQKSDSATLLLRQVQRMLGSVSESRLPVLTDNANANASANAGHPHSGTHLKAQGAEEKYVLLVDRDMATLSAMRDVVRKMGGQCEFALSTKQAQDKLQSSRQPDAIVISDDMPQSGALTLFESAVSLAAHFRRRFVFTTDGASGARRPSGFNGPVVRKPIAPLALQSALLNAFESAADSSRQAGVDRVNAS